MHSDSYLPAHPSVLKKVSPPANKHHSSLHLDVEKMAEQVIKRQRVIIGEMQARITAHEVQIQAEVSCRIDHTPSIEAIQREISHIRNEETYINEQIRNCQLVENTVTPMEYYLWKKKQRINTYDASIAEAYRLVQKQRDAIESSIQAFRAEGEQLASQNQAYQEKINYLHTAPGQTQEQLKTSEETLQELIALNVNIKGEYLGLTNTIEILQENKDIVCMQVVDNIRSIEGTLRSHFDSEKAKLVKQFKQMQLESRSSEVSPLTTEEQNYKLDPLLSDYSLKLKEMASLAPESVKNLISPIMQPMTWEKFHWKDFLDIEPKSEQIYAEYRKLESQYMQNESSIEKLQEQIKQITHQLITQQQRSSQIGENIRKLKKTLKK